MSSLSPTDPKRYIAELLSAALRRIATSPVTACIVLERPKLSRHGDYACNIALHLAKSLKRSPRDIASSLVAALPVTNWLEKTEIAGAGFINFFLKPAFKQQIVSHILRSGNAYGRSQLGQRKKMLVEFVSANPTGPLHVGHGRGAAYGASLANLLDAAGFSVTREFYVNDGGRQTDILALSTWLRYLELAGMQMRFPPNAYQGNYVTNMARQLLAIYATQFVRDTEQVVAGVPEFGEPEARLDALIANARALLGPDFETINTFALQEQLADCREDLIEFGVEFDRWFSERSLFDTDLVGHALRQLDNRGHIYLQDGARWFRSSRFGDEKDRVVQRENGQYTYFASDIAYHLNKFERGFDLLIDIWGADHHGYIARVEAALEALGLDRERLTVALVQFAVLYRDGQKVSMSTRAGEFVTLRELRREVGNDAARFFYVLRKSDQHLDFDLDLAKSQSTDNPVYYVQYAHARVCSVLAQWSGDATSLSDVDTSPLVSEQELSLLQRLIEYHETVESAARDLAPHLIAFYLRELAGEFHRYYNATRVLVDEEPIRLARLALASAIRQVLRNGLTLLGVSAPEKM